MSLTVGAVSVVQVGATSASVSSAVATSGSAPYAYQWYRSTVSGFTPGVGNIVAGATSLGLADTQLTPGTAYFYKNVVIDSAAATVTSAQLQVGTVAVQNPNQFAETVVVGQMDQAYNYDTTEVEIDASQSGSLVAGQAVKLVDSAGGVPKVIACAANSDLVYGFIQYNIKNRTFVAGDRAEVSQDGNVMYLISTGAISRGAKVTLDLSYVGGVATSTSGNCIVGSAFDKATAPGQTIRVRLNGPSYTLA